MISIGTSSSWNSYENNQKYHTKKLIQKVDFSAWEILLIVKFPKKPYGKKYAKSQECGGG